MNARVREHGPAQLVDLEGVGGVLKRLLHLAVPTGHAGDVEVTIRKKCSGARVLGSYIRRS